MLRIWQRCSSRPWRTRPRTRLPSRCRPRTTRHHKRPSFQQTVMTQMTTATVTTIAITTLLHRLHQTPRPLSPQKHLNPKSPVATTLSQAGTSLPQGRFADSRCIRRNCRFLHATEEDTGRCNICFEENVKIFGLMSSCNHTFCMSCTRKWRKTKTGDTAKKWYPPPGPLPLPFSIPLPPFHYHTVLCWFCSMVVPTCFSYAGHSLMYSPVCRQDTKRVIPSSAFFPLGSAARDEYLKHYTETLGTKPCRYFEESKKNAPAGQESKYHCPFLNKCLFVHEVEGEKYVFSKRDIRRGKAARKLKL